MVLFIILVAPCRIHHYVFWEQTLWHASYFHQIRIPTKFNALIISGDKINPSISMNIRNGFLVTQKEYATYSYKKPIVLPCVPFIQFSSILLQFDIFITFFYMHKKKVLDSRKFSTSGFRWIWMFWSVLNTIWPFLENVCLSVYMHVSKILWTLYLKN